MSWSATTVTWRLRIVVQAVPRYTIGGGTQSAALGGILAYARDMTIVQSLTIDVMNALLAPTPDREFGDDGYREELRATALDALAWAERWVDWRRASDWTSDTNGRTTYRGPLQGGAS